MRSIWILAQNTFREVVRDRILYALILFAILLMGFSLLLGQLSFAEQTRISADFGLSAIHLCAIILAIFVGSNLVFKEIDKKTILTILVRPIKRPQFILGKAMGLAFVIALMCLCLSLILGLVFWGLGIGTGVRFLVVLLGILAESLVLLGYTMVFAMFARPMLVVALTIAVFLIGHWQSSLNFFVERDNSESLKLLSWFIRHVIPDLERLNWKDLMVYDIPLNFWSRCSSLGYAIMWFGLTISLAAYLFRRKDVG